MTERTVTIFGASGFIGRHVVRRLAECGAQIRAATRDLEQALFLKPMGDVGQIAPVQANIRDDASVRAAIGRSDAVVNLVGILYESGRQTFKSVHAEGARRVAEAAREAGVSRLVHVSALGAAEQSPSKYARSKAQGEAAVRAGFADAVILRPGVVFGPQDDFFNRFADMTRWSPSLPVFGCPLPRIRDGSLDLYGDGGTRFQPVYVDDVARAVRKGLTDESTTGKTYELAGPTVYSFVEVMRLVLNETNRRRLIVPVPFWLGSLMAFFAERLPVPPLTRDQVTLLKSDNVAGGDLPALLDLGVTPTAIEAILPTYLDVYRRGGRFSQSHSV
jgi:uncharacterized protein YbjT (DUF2867 family)